MALCGFVKWSCSLQTSVLISRPPHIWPKGNQGGVRDLRRQRHVREEMHQRRIHQRPLLPHGFSPVHEVGDASDCGAQQTRSRALRRSPREGEREWSQATWCRTADQNEHDALLRERAERWIDSGCGRSSAEAVTALGPTVLQNCAAGTCAHARTKAMLTKFASVVGLKGALHGASYWDKLRQRSADYENEPVPAARDERLAQANGRRTRPTATLQIWLIHKSCYGHLPRGIPPCSHPQPVDCAVDEPKGATNEQSRSSVECNSTTPQSTSV